MKVEADEEELIDRVLGGLRLSEAVSSWFPVELLRCDSWVNEDTLLARVVGWDKLWFSRKIFIFAIKW